MNIGIGIGVNFQMGELSFVEVEEQTPPQDTTGFVTFIDDDARKGVYTDLLPLFNSRNAKFNIAVATGFVDGLTVEQGMTSTDVIGTQYYASWEQLREIRDQGHGIISHSVHHKSHQFIGLSQELLEFQDSKTRLHEEGLTNVKSYAYPYCEVSANNSVEVLDYYDIAFRCTPTSMIFNPLTTVQKATLPRTGIGSWGVDYPVQTIKDLCLQAKNEGKWFAIMTHIDHINDNPWTKASTLAVITEVLDFCVANGIEVIGINDAMDRMNLLSAPEPNTDPTVLFMTPSETYTGTKRITMSTNKYGDSTIYYTTDGTTPTTSSDVYTSPITLVETKTVKAFAVDGLGNASAIQTQTYTKRNETVLVELDAANHGTDPNIWEDLSGSGQHVTLYNFTHDGTTNGWTSDGLLLNGVNTYLKNDALKLFNQSMASQNFILEFIFAALDINDGKSAYYLGLMKEANPFHGLKLSKGTTTTVDLQLNLGTSYSGTPALTSSPTSATRDRLVVKHMDGVLTYELNGVIFRTFNTPQFTTTVDQPFYLGANIISGTVQRFAKIRVNKFKMTLLG